MVFFSLSFALSLSSTLPLRENNGRKFGPSSSTSMKRKFFLSRAAIIRGGSQHGQTKSGLVLYTSHYQLVSYRVFILSHSKLREWIEKSRQAQYLAINKKSIIVVLSLWNLVKIFISWVIHVVWISAWLDQDCGFFISEQVLGLSTFFTHPL